jgi:hypothetical protein
MNDDNLTLEQHNINYLTKIYKFNIKDLKKIAKELKISNVSTYKKDSNKYIHTISTISNVIVNNENYVLKSIEEMKYNLKNLELDKKIQLYKKVAINIYKNTKPQKNDNYDKPCLLFTLNEKKSSYPVVKICGKTTYVHRLSYALKMKIFIEDIPKIQNGKRVVVCHGKKCDRRCIEPSHLDLKTEDENLFDDKIRDGTLNIGEKHYNSKIDSVLAIKILNSKGTKTAIERSKEFGVTYETVRNIDYKKSWNHITGENYKSIRLASSLRRKRNKERIFSEEDWTNLSLYLKKNSNISETLFYNHSTCHIWKNSKDKSGYAIAKFKGVSKRGHIFALEANQKKERDNKEKCIVRHLCNNKSCVNPEHLKFGTYKENMIDARNNGSKSAKLNEFQVQYIKLLLKFKMNIKDISVFFDVSTSTIYSIKNLKSWADITFEKHILAKILGF